ncbi:hypothetical protein [Nostoc sp. ChiSLP03a]|nr:hypothetical protein [Nostoc sp. ChiSLP03a]MDZ8211362.1 hypothetical protein [Nostoc sp. ChiSLP03a]
MNYNLIIQPEAEYDIQDALNSQVFHLISSIGIKLSYTHLVPRVRSL